MVDFFLRGPFAPELKRRAKKKKQVVEVASGNKKKGWTAGAGSLAPGDGHAAHLDQGVGHQEGRHARRHARVAVASGGHAL